MAKTVFGSHAMTAHVWAQGHKGYGRAGDSRMFFKDSTLFSYGEHFALGYRTPDGIHLLNSDRNSISTSKHQGHTRHAAARPVYVAGLTDLVAGWSAPLARLIDPERRATLDAADVARLRAAIVSHVEKHALEQGAEGAAFLLEAAGIKPAVAPARFEKIKAAAIKARDKKAAEAKARALQLTQSEGKFSAGDSDATWAARIARVLADDRKLYLPDPQVTWYKRMVYRTPSAEEKLAALALTIHREVKALRASPKLAKPTAILSARLKALRLEIAALRADRVGAERRLQVRNAIRILHAPFPDTLERLGHASAALEALEDAKAFGLGSRVPLRTFMLDTAARIAVEVKRLEAIREAEHAAKQAEAVAEWREGNGSRYARFSDSKGGALLRADHVDRDGSGAIVGGLLVTSHGADVPLVHAIKAFRFLKLCRETGTPWNRNGRTIRVGHFQVDAVESDGSFKAGCHVINWPEIEALAIKLGVFTIAADASAVVSSYEVA